MDGFQHKLVYSAKEVDLYLQSIDFNTETIKSQIVFKKIPGEHLRVSKDDFENFLQNNNVPIPEAWNQQVKPFKVLIVDDEPDLLEIMTELLKEEKRITIRSEKNGFNAEIQIKGWMPDLVLLDFLMPGISGFEICKRLKQDPCLSDIPILAMTSLTSTENKSSVIEAGISDFLGKPFYSESLLLKVRELLVI